MANVQDLFILTSLKLSCGWWAGKELLPLGLAKLSTNLIFPAFKAWFFDVVNSVLGQVIGGVKEHRCGTLKIHFQLPAEPAKNTLNPQQFWAREKIL